MLAGNVVVGAEDRPLEKREAGFGEVNVNDASHHFAPGMVNPFVAGEVWRHFPIGDMAVRYDMRGIVHIEANEGAQGGREQSRPLFVTGSIQLPSLPAESQIPCLIFLQRGATARHEFRLGLDPHLD